MIVQREECNNRDKRTTAHPYYFYEMKVVGFVEISKQPQVSLSTNRVHHCTTRGNTSASLFGQVRIQIGDCTHTQIVIRSHVYRSGLALKLLAGVTVLHMPNRILDRLADDRFHFTRSFCMCDSACFDGKVGPLPTVSKK